MELVKFALLLGVLGGFLRIHGVGSQRGTSHDEAGLGGVGAEGFGELAVLLAGARFTDAAFFGDVGAEEEGAAGYAYVVFPG